MVEQAAPSVRNLHENLEVRVVLLYGMKLQNGFLFSLDRWLVSPIEGSSPSRSFKASLLTSQAGMYASDRGILTPESLPRIAFILVFMEVFLV